MSEYVAALGRMGINPEVQGPHPSFEQMIQALELLTESEAVGLMIAWLTLQAQARE